MKILWQFIVLIFFYYYISKLNKRYYRRKKKAKKNKEEEEEGKCNSENFMIFSLQIISSMLLRVGGQ